MTNSAKRIALTSAASAIALFAGLATASAATITVVSAHLYATDPGPPSPFALANIPCGGGCPANSFISSSPFTTNGFSASFAGGSAGDPSGVYTGNQPNIAASPFGAGNATLPYLVAGGSSGVVTLTYSGPQSELDLLWGTVDTDLNRNTLTISLGPTVITGADILAAVQAQGFGSFANQTADVYLRISGLGGTFTQATFSDTGVAGTPAFEFVPGAVPEPATWAMMLLGFVGLGFAFRQSRRKVSMA
jgi:hypothetical protein